MYCPLDLRNKVQCNSTQNAKVLLHGNAFKMPFAECQPFWSTQTPILLIPALCQMLPWSYRLLYVQQIAISNWSGSNDAYMLACWWDPLEHNSVKFELKRISLHTRKSILKCRLQSGGHFVSTPMCFNCIARTTAAWSYNSHVLYIILISHHFVRFINIRSPGSPFTNMV